MPRHRVALRRASGHQDVGAAVQARADDPLQPTLLPSLVSPDVLGG
jgi:hypothetical protein